MDVETAGFIRIFFITDGLFYVFCYVFYVLSAVALQHGVYGAAARVAKHHHKAGAQMICRIFDAAQLMIVYDIAGKPDDKQIAYSCAEDALRNDS